MQQNNPSGYRIKKHRNNYITDDYMKQQQDVFKMSIHSSSNKSPNKNKNSHSVRDKDSPKKNQRNLSLANRQFDSDKYSQRSKKSSQTNMTKGNPNMSSSSVSGGSRRIEQSVKIKQFANVKQLLMIKAYDKKLLRNVTGSSQANKNFLKLGDINSDPFRKQTFKVMIQNFKQLTIRIRKGYQKVLNKILFQPTSSPSSPFPSAIHTLASVQPILQKVRLEADEMCCKVKQCQQAHDSRQFRSLLQKFLTFLNAAQDIQEIILIVNQSKNRIDDLFKNLEKEKERGIGDKVNAQRKKGIKRVRNAVKDYGNDGVEAQILGKVQAAINQMADKNLQAYGKINGARGLMSRIGQCLRDNKDFYELEDIIKINKIFREVLAQAKSYEKFVDKFMQEGDIINDDLRACILRYRQQVQIKKEAVETMEIKFISNIIETSVHSFQANYSVCNAIDSTVIQDYTKMQNLLQSICQLISSQNAKATIKSMVRDIQPLFKNIQKQIKKIKKTKKSFSIDSQEDLQKLLQLSALINTYKAQLRQIIQRQQRAYRQITKKRFKRQQIPEPDLQQNFLQKLTRLGQKLISKSQLSAIQSCQFLSPISPSASCTIQTLSSQLPSKIFLTQFSTLNSQLQSLSHNNELSSIICQIKIEHPLYELSQKFIEIVNLCTTVTQSNLIQKLGQISQKLKGEDKEKRNRTESEKEIFGLFRERAYAMTIVKGIDKRLVKIVNQSKFIQFPENQHDVQGLRRDSKYLRTVGGLLKEGTVKEKLQKSFQIMDEVLDGIKIAQEIKWNQNGLYYVKEAKIFKCVENEFNNCFKQKQPLELESLHKEVKKIIGNLQQIQKKQRESRLNETRVEKIVNIIKKYQKINQKFDDSIKRVKQLEPVHGYCQFVFHCCQYMQSTLQSFYGILNKNKNIFWISQLPKQPMKNSKFGQFIGLTSLKQGELCQKYNEKAAIQPDRPKPKPKPSKLQKSANKKNKNKSEDMDEQIEQASRSQSQPEDIVDDMEENMEMEEDMEEDMVEEMGEQIGEMEDQIPDDQIPDEEEAQDGVVDDIEDQEEMEKKKKDKQKEMQQKMVKQQKKVNKTSQKIQVSVSSPQKQKKQPQQPITIKQKKLSTTFEIFKYIQTMQDLQIILTKIKNLRLNFWKSIDLKILQNYFNHEHKQTQIQAFLNKQLQNFLKSNFLPDFLPSIKNSPTHSQLLAQFSSLDCLKLSNLSQVLALLSKQHSILVGTNKQLLRISISSADPSWQPSVCIKSYLSCQFSQPASLSLQNFQSTEYIFQLISTRNKKSLQTKYEFPDKRMQIKKQEIAQKVGNIQKIIGDYEDMRKFPDGMDLRGCMAGLWQTVLTGGQVKGEIGVKGPNKILEDLEQIQVIKNQLNWLYYFGELRAKAMKTAQKMKNHNDKLIKILSSTTKENILQSISKLIEIYQPSAQKIIYLKQQPIFICLPSSSSPQMLSLLSTLFTSPSSPLLPVQLHQNLSAHPQLYAQFHSQCCLLLSILGIESHIYPSENKLFVESKKQQIVKEIVKTVTNGVVGDGVSSMEGGLDGKQGKNGVMDGIGIKKKERNVFQYGIKDIDIMNKQNNAQYHKQFQQFLSQYSTIKQSKIQIGDSIFQNIFKLQSAQNSITSQIFDYTESLSLLLKQKQKTLYQNQELTSIFRYHVPTQQKLQKIKQNIDGEVRLLLSIVQEPIQIDIGIDGKQKEGEKELELAIRKGMDSIQERSKLVEKWYRDYQSRERKQPKQGLNQVNVCACFGGKCEKQFTIYVGEKAKCLARYINKICGDDKAYQKYVKKFEQQKQKNGMKSSTTLHLGKLLTFLTSKLKTSDQQSMSAFINQYNLFHFQIIESKSKISPLADMHKKIFSQNETKLEITKLLQNCSENIKKSVALYKIFHQVLESGIGKKLGEIGRSLDQENEKLKEISINNGNDKTEYTKFGNWIINVFGKIYKFKFYILLDKGTKQLVCMMAAKTEQQVQKCLKSLKLPTELTPIDQSHFHTYRKIKLTTQKISYKFDEKQLKRQQIQQFCKCNFGIDKPETSQKETWIFGVYKKLPENQQNLDDQKLLALEQIDQNLLEKARDVEIYLNQNQIKAQLSFKILEAKIKKGEKMDENSIVRQVKSQNYSNVYLNDSICLSALSKWMKNELTKYKKKKADQHAQFLLQQQKKKKQEQQLQKQKMQQQRLQKQNLKNKQKDPQFLLEDNGKQQSKESKQIKSSSSIVKQQAEQYLDMLYQQLTLQQVYSISKDQIYKQKSNEKETQNKLHAAKQFKSLKNLQIIGGTEKAIKQVEGDLQGQIKKQFQQIAQNYLSGIEQRLYQRQQILQQVLRQSKTLALQSQPNAQKQKIAHQQKILQQFCTMPGYSQDMKSSIIVCLRDLSQDKKQKLASIYQNKWKQQNMKKNTDK